jgi:hypothetical protein
LNPLWIFFGIKVVSDSFAHLNFFLGI